MARERRQAAERDQELKQLLQGAIDALTSHIAILDRRGVIIKINASWRRFAEHNFFTGLNYGIGSNYLDACTSSNPEPSDCDTPGQKAANGIRDVISGANKLFEYEYPCHSPDEQRWFVMRVTRFGSGDNLRVVVAHENVTARKLAELERERLLVSEQEARRQAEAATRLKDEFLATVSHELRSPLNAMLGYVKLLRVGEPDEMTLANYLGIIERSAKAQNQLIEDLLDTSRIVSGKLRLDPRPLNVTEVIEKSLDVVRPAAAARSIELRVLLDYEAGQVVGDPDRLQQVIWNLLSNANKFTPEGGSVSIESWRQHAQVCVAVRDTGNGISPDFLPYVFDRFRQGDASSARRYGGLGLGLALVRHLVELHGGEVEAHSDGPGQGAAFIVRLPMRVPDGFVRDKAAEVVIRELGNETAANSPAPTLLAGAHLLVLDDHEQTRELLTVALARYGADVIAAATGKEAFALIVENLASRPVNVFICDIGMPDEDGYAALRRVREWENERGVPPARRLPAIALTAYTGAADRVRALAASFQMHVPKPVEPDELAVVIASLTGRLRHD
jgi:signal transduction histidine kinase/ActR/RegA family two-component response regulator